VFSAGAIYYFTRIKCKYCLYFRQTKDRTVLTGIHINDFLLTASSLLQAANFKRQIASIWEISDLGEAKFCVGIAIEHDLINHHIYLAQTALIDKILTLFNMADCNPVLTPMETGLVLSRQSDTVLTRQEEIELLDLPYRRLVGLLRFCFCSALTADGQQHFLLSGCGLSWLPALRRLSPAVVCNAAFQGIH